jgi:hypothetical protein
MGLISSAAAARRGKEVTRFVAAVVAIYTLLLLLLINQSSDEEAEKIVDRQGFGWVASAFATAIVIESLHICWGVSPAKAKVIFLVLSVKVLAFTTALAVACGFSPVWLDFRGRLLVPGRFLQWTPRRRSSSSSLKHAQ